MAKCIAGATPLIAILDFQPCNPLRPWCAGPSPASSFRRKPGIQKGAGTGEVSRHIVRPTACAGTSSITSHHSHRLAAPAPPTLPSTNNQSVFIPSSAGASLHEQCGVESNRPGTPGRHSSYPGCAGALWSGFKPVDRRIPHQPNSAGAPSRNCGTWWRDNGARSKTTRGEGLVPRRGHAVGRRRQTGIATAGTIHPQT